MIQKEPIGLDKTGLETSGPGSEGGEVGGGSLRRPEDDRGQQETGKNK